LSPFAVQIVLLLLKQNDYIGLAKTSQAKQKIKAASAAGFSARACHRGQKGVYNFAVL